MVYFRLIEKSQSGIIWNLTKLFKMIRMNRIVHDTDKITCPSKSPRCFDVNLANVKATARLCRIFVAILENLIFLKSTLQHWPSRQWAKRGAWPWDNITAASTNIGCCAKIECSPSTKHGMSQLGGIEFKLKSDTVAAHFRETPSIKSRTWVTLHFIKWKIKFIYSETFLEKVLSFVKSHNS